MCWVQAQRQKPCQSDAQEQRYTCRLIRALFASWTPPAFHIVYPLSMAGKCLCPQIKTHSKYPTHLNFYPLALVVIPVMPRLSWPFAAFHFFFHIKYKMQTHWIKFIIQSLPTASDVCATISSILILSLLPQIVVCGWSFLFTHRLSPPFLLQSYRDR